jgi:hypothetical protein
VTFRLVPEDMSGGSKVWPVRKSVKLTAIHEPIVQTMWDPGHFTTV